MHAASNSLLLSISKLAWKEFRYIAILNYSFFKKKIVDVSKSELPID